MPSKTILIDPTAVTVTTIPLAGPLNTLSVTNLDTAPNPGSRKVYVNLDPNGGVPAPSTSIALDSGGNLQLGPEDTSHPLDGAGGKVSTESITLTGGGGTGIGTFGGGAGATFPVLVAWTVKRSPRQAQAEGRALVEQG